MAVSGKAMQQNDRFPRAVTARDVQGARFTVPVCEGLNICGAISFCPLPDNVGLLHAAKWACALYVI